MSKDKIYPSKQRDPNWKDLLETKSGPMPNKKKKENKNKCRAPVIKEENKGNNDISFPWLKSREFVETPTD